MSVTFLSAQWFDALREQLDGVPPVPADKSGGLRIGQLVTGAPDGADHAWTLELRPGAAPSLEIGTVESADVVLVEGFEAAWALASGARTAGQLLEAGELKIRGDARRLVAASDLLEALAAASGALRELTVRD
ncbi:MAG: hypothetical protein ACLPQS_07450 [Acidimicrobiales bacterium]